MLLEYIQNLLYAVLGGIGVFWLVALYKWHQYRRMLQQRIETLDREIKRNDEKDESGSTG